MISRADRETLLAAIRRFTAEQLTAHGLDAALAELRERTDDETVRFTAQALWPLYDDLEDHVIAATKSEWDFFQRFLLLLDSDGELVFTTHKDWTIRQPLAAFALAGWVWAASERGLGYGLLVATLLAGLASVFFSRWRQAAGAGSGDGRRFPFGSFAELRAVRRRCPTFRKQPYPPHLTARTLRRSVLRRLIALPSYLLWLGLSPIVLACQMLPEKRSTHSVLLADA